MLAGVVGATVVGIGINSVQANKYLQMIRSEREVRRSSLPRRSSSLLCVTGPREGRPCAVCLSQFSFHGERLSSQLCRQTEEEVRVQSVYRAFSEIDLTR